MSTEKTKRTWCFVQPPTYFDIKCKCGAEVQWSEYDRHVWCPDCDNDISDYESPMDGPTPMHLASLLMDLRVIDFTDNKVKELEEILQK